MKLLTFETGGELFGININSVKEINRRVILTEIPASPPRIMGLYNMRGQIVTVFDIAHMLGYSEGRYNYKSVNGKLFTCVIMKPDAASDLAAFAVDATRDVIFVDSPMKSVPANVELKMRENLTGVFELEEELLLVIDEKKLFFKHEKESIGEMATSAEITPIAAKELTNG